MYVNVFSTEATYSDGSKPNGMSIWLSFFSSVQKSYESTNTVRTGQLQVEVADSPIEAIGFATVVILFQN